MQVSKNRVESSNAKWARNGKQRLGLRWLLPAVIVGCTIPSVVQAATVTVNTTAPDTAGDGKCGLTEAIQAVNQMSTYRNCTYTANGQSDRIIFSVNGTHNIVGATLNRSVEIMGNGAGSTTIASPAFCTICAFGLASGAKQTVWLRSLTLSGPNNGYFGVYASGGSPITISFNDAVVRGFGTAMYVGGNSTLTQLYNTTIENNSTGVAVSEGALKADYCTIRNNTSGGIVITNASNSTSAYSYIYDSTISGNSSDKGAGVYVASNRDSSFGPTLYINRTTFTNNQATIHGGGLYAEASVDIDTSVFDGNSAANTGGGLMAAERPSFDSVMVHVTETTFKNNTAAKGAGFANYGPSDGQRVKVSLSRSTFGPNNVASGDGGGIYSRSQIDWAENLTIYNNRAARGGGLFHDSGGESHVFHSTITDNVATQANGGAGMWLITGNPIYAYNIIAQNKVGATTNNIVTTNPSLNASYNLLDNVSGVSALFPTASSGGTNIVANPQLGSFGFYGGPTYVRPLLASSPAIDAIPSNVGDSTNIDQRGWSRPIDSNLNGYDSFDIGAVEMNAASTMLEAESLTVAAQSSETLGIDSHVNYSGGQARRKQANQNGYLTLQTGTLQPGTYGVIVRFKKAANAGRFQLAVGTSAGSTTNLGGVQDAYNGSNQWTSVNVGTITINSAGTRYFKFTAPSKNGSSSGYWMFIDAIQLYKST